MLVEAGLSPKFLRKSCAGLVDLMPHARVVTLEHSGHHIGLDVRDELIGILRESVPPPAAPTTGD